MADTAMMLELLEALKSSEAPARDAAEEKFREAQDQSPDSLMLGLLSVLGSGSVDQRSQAAVLLRQCIAGSGTRQALWENLAGSTHAALKQQLLAAMQGDQEVKVKRSLAYAVAAASSACGNSFESLNQSWPELMPALSQLTTGNDDLARVAALNCLQELVGTAGEGLLRAGGEQVVAMLQACLSHGSAEVCLAGSELLLQLVEDLEPEATKVLAVVAKALPSAVQRLSSSEHLKDILEAVVSCMDEEPEFFRDSGCLPELWTTLLSLATTDAVEASTQHTAMEAVVSMASGLAGDFCKAEGQPMLESLLRLNIQWMVQVDENLETWTTAPEDDDDIDDETVELGEANLDRLADCCAKEDALEDAFMPLLFKIIQELQQDPGSTWKHARACVMAVSQVSEHIEEEPWIDRCIEFILPFLTHEHARVRDAGFVAVGQMVYDHDPYCQEEHADALLEAMVVGMDDTNVRVAATAADTFAHLCDELDGEDLMPHLDNLLTRLIKRLGLQETTVLQEKCLVGISAIAEVLEEEFAPYYEDVMPMLKRLVETSTNTTNRVLCGKAIQCISLIGEAVGKEAFLRDGHDVMRALMVIAQDGFAADDQLKEYAQEASGRICVAMGKEFKQYVPALLPGLLKTLGNKPQQMGDDDDEAEDMTLSFAGDKVYGLKTTLVQEMEEALSLVCTLLTALEEEFCEFLPPTCQTLLPLLDLDFDGVREKAIKTWQLMAECSRSAAQQGRLDPAAVHELVGGFLQKSAASMSKFPGEEMDASALDTLQAQAAGVTGMIQKAGEGILGKEEVQQLLALALDLLGRVTSASSEPIEASIKRRAVEAGDDDSDSEASTDEGDGATRQSVRFALVDLLGALMRVCPTVVAEVGLEPITDMIVKLLSTQASDGDRSLALYAADTLVEILGPLSLPGWNHFMEGALNCTSDKSPAVRQYAASVLGSAAKVPAFRVMAPVAAQRLAQELQKHGARHRRRRATTADGKQLALAVDSAIRAFGLLCEHQEQSIGGDVRSAWSMWLENLPLRYDQEQGHRAHKQLLELLVKEHPVVSGAENLPRVLRCFATIYKTKFSTSALNKQIAEVVLRLREISRAVAAELPEKPRKRIENILKPKSDSA